MINQVLTFFLLFVVHILSIKSYLRFNLDYKFIFLFLRELFGFQIEKIVSVFYELELSKKKLHAKINNQIYLQTIFYFFDSRIGFATINSTKLFLYSGFSLYRGILFIVKYFPNSAKKC